jgi:acetyl/propionyl-CoA carboxylase alpha subunit
LDTGSIALVFRSAWAVIVCLGGDPVPALLRSCTPESVEVEIDGVLRTFATHHIDDTWYVDSVLGHSALIEQPRFPQSQASAEPGSLRSPMPGKVVSVSAQENQPVEPGAVLVVIEAMKMEHSVSAPHSGTVTSVRVEPGDQVESDQVLIIVSEGADE